MLSKAPRIGRLAFQFGLTFALAVSAAGAIVFTQARTQIENTTDRQLAHEGERLLRAGGARSTPEIARLVLAGQNARAIAERVEVLFDRQGTIIAGRVVLALPTLGYADVHFRDGSPKWHEGRALRLDLADGGHLVILAHSEIGEAMGKLLPTAALSIMAVAGLVGLIATWFFAAVIAARIARTLATADAIVAGDLSHRIAVKNLDGIFAEQATSLNRMLDRMEELVRTQRNFASNLAHDLRTPLTRLRGMIAENMDHGPSRFLEQAERECNSIIAIFDALLRLSRIEAGQMPLGPEHLPLRAIVEDVAETMEPVLADRGGALHLGAMAELAILADASLITQLLVNLIENIALHTPSHTTASITLYADAASGEAVIEVADDGPGLAGQDLARLLKPFERGAASSSGSGLGLAIAQAIVRFHRGELRLLDNRPGLIVMLRFPLVPPPASLNAPSSRAGA